jgi:hypothetical protein
MRSEWVSILVTVKKQANGYILKTMKLDKKVWGFETFEAARNLETVQLKKMSFQKKSSTITYLRECYYGREATTGRLQRIFEVSEFSPG